MRPDMFKRPRTAQSSEKITLHPDGRIAYERTTTFVPEILATCFGLSVLALAIFVGFGLIDSSVLTGVIAAIGGASAVLYANEKRKSSSWSIWIAVALLAGLAMLALAAWLVFDESAWQIVETRFSFSPSA